MCHDGEHGMWVRQLLLREADVCRAKINLPPSLTNNQDKLRNWRDAKRLKRSAGENQTFDIEWKILESGAWSAQVGHLLAREIYLLVEEVTDIDYRWSVSEVKRDKQVATLVSPAFRYGRLWIALEASEMWYNFILGNYHPDDALQLVLKLTHPWRYRKGEFTSLENIYEKEESYESQHEKNS